MVTFTWFSFTLRAIGTLKSDLSKASVTKIEMTLMFKKSKKSEIFEKSNVTTF